MSRAGRPLPGVTCATRLWGADLEAFAAECQRRNVSRSTGLRLAVRAWTAAHLTDEQIAAWIDRGLQAKERAQCAGHLEVCGACAVLLARARETIARIQKGAR